LLGTWAENANLDDDILRENVKVIKKNNFKLFKIKIEKVEK